MWAVEQIKLISPGQNGHYFTEDIFKCVFMNEKFFYLNFTEVYSQVCNWQWFRMTLGNGLAANRQPAITWTNADPFLGPSSLAHICDTGEMGQLHISSVALTQLLHNHRSLRDVHKHWPSVRFTNRAQTQYSDIRTSRVLWAKYELMTYVVAYSTHMKLCRKICLEKSFSIWGCWDSTLGNNPLSETNLLWLCLGNVQCWYSLTYDMKLPSPALHVCIWNFTMKVLYHIKPSITRFDMFRKIYNQKILQC